MRIAVIGASGFVGSAVTHKFEMMGAEVQALRAPRLSGPDRLVDHQSRAIQEPANALASEMTRLGSVDCVVNCAGAAVPAAPESTALFGANGLLPGVVVYAAAAAGAGRVIHVSSSSVHGRAHTLDESATPTPFSPYSRSKLLGEFQFQACAEDLGLPFAILRPTSVHGARRATTRSLIRFAQSRYTSCAAGQPRPTPQVLVTSVANAVEFLTCAEDTPDGAVLQPWEGLTTTGFLTAIGGGRRPARIPAVIARAVIRTSGGVGRASSTANATARRLEMLWFGQAQNPGWLERRGFHPATSIEDWRRLAELVTAGGQE